MVFPSAPSWLNKGLKFCFNWMPSNGGDGGQCGDVPSNTECMYNGKWTNYYRDDTDRRPGGCLMRWGFFLYL